MSEKTLSTYFQPLSPQRAAFMLSRLANVLQELSGEEGVDGEPQVSGQ